MPARCRATDESSRFARFIVHVSAVCALLTLLVPSDATAQSLRVGPNVNMVSGTTLPNGDPWLQRQNEPSIAVSTRNPCHLLAGANDYRTVDMPGLPDDKETGDSWPGLYKSYDCGRSWKTWLVPGFPQDTTPEGASSPLHGLAAGADPIVRAGTNGLFYYSGMAFNRGAGAASKVFVARFIDDNDQTPQKKEDSIDYVGTTVVDSGTTGQFTDKPSLVVDIPRGKKIRSCTVNGQTFNAGNVYAAWTRFTGDPANNVTKLMVARSLNCGATFENGVKVSEGYMTNQGATMAIDPTNGTIYVAWRQYLSDSGQNAILVSRSTDAGATFSKATLVSAINPFDQGGGGASFRTVAYPSVAVDGSGDVYVAWSQRGVGPGGDARIVMTVSPDGVTWPASQPVANDIASRGHQIMPAMIVARGILQIVWYDLIDDHTSVRYDWDPINADPLIWPYKKVRVLEGDLAGTPSHPEKVFWDYVADMLPPGMTGTLQRRHSIEVRAAQLNLGNPSAGFTTGRLTEYALGTWAPSGTNTNPPIVQMQFDPPNLPLFAQGTSAFIGDYVDVAALSFVRNADGTWSFNTAPGASAPMFHAVWTDNRDVSPPPAGKTWADYTAPKGGQTCVAGTTGMRNSNIYTATILPPLVVGSLDNSKRLNATTPRPFPIFIQNTTTTEKHYLLTVTDPPGGTASFLEFAAPSVHNLYLTLGAMSGAARTVYVKSTQYDAQVTVTAVQVTSPDSGGTLVTGGDQGSVLLNPDPASPAIMNPAIMNETYNPAIMNRTITNPAIMNPAIMNPAIMNPAIMNPADPAWSLINPAIMNPAIMNPAIMNPAIMNPAIMNPAIMNPAIMNPAIMNPAIMNPAIMNPAIMNGALPADAIVIDTTWTIRNDGTSAASYTIDLAGTKQLPSGNAINSMSSQLILHKRYVTPGVAAVVTTGNANPSAACELGLHTDDVILANIPNPILAGPDGTPVTNPAVMNATMALAPGEEGFVTLRLIDPNRLDNLVTYDPGSDRYFSYDPTFNPATDVSIQPITQPVNEPPLPPAQAPAVSFSQQPATAEAGQALPPVTVSVTPAPASPAKVTLALVANGNPGILTGTLSADTGASGVATFSDLHVSTAGTGYQLRATLPGSTPVVSSAFNISAPPVAPGTVMWFSALPANIQGGQAVAFDLYSTPPMAGVTVALSFASNPGSATLSGSTAIADVGGVAHFSVTIDRGGYGYALTATAGTATVTSGPFDIAGFAATTSLVPGPPTIDATLTRLDGNKALRAGGEDGAFTARNEASIYDAASGTFTATGPMLSARYGHTATRLPDGRVLVAGGIGSPAFILATGETYDPVAGSFLETGWMQQARYNHTATLLPGGKVLIAGGDNGQEFPFIASAELFDARDGTFALTGAMNIARENHTATLLSDGKVLIAGGTVSVFGNRTSTAELYDPDTRAFTQTLGSLATARMLHTATLLRNGRVLIAGGYGDGGFNPLASAELYDPATQTFIAAGTGGAMTAARAAHTATLLPDGRVLLAGGAGTPALSSAEIYDPATDSFAATGTMTVGRGHFGAALLDTGRVLVAGDYTNTAELYFQSSPAAASVLRVVSAPAHGTVGVPLDAIQVSARDDQDAPLAGVPVVIGVQSAPGGGAIAGLLPTLVATTDVAGIATFTNVYAKVAGAYTLRAWSPLDVFESVASAPIDIGNPTITFGPLPAISAGQPFSVTVNATAFMTGTPLSVGSITLTLNSGSNGGALLGGPQIVPLVGGTATFSNVTITQPGLGYELVASYSGGLVTQSSGAFDVAAYVPPPSSIVAFVTQPARGLNLKNLAPAVTVHIADGTATPQPGVAVTLSLGANPTGASLNNTTAITDAAGDASFPNLQVTRGGYSFTLIASAPNSAPATSTAFDIIGFAPGLSLTAGRRSGFTMTRLGDGRVLIAGGSADGTTATVTNVAEIYDPVAGTIQTATMTTGRMNHAATLLPSGQVLITGGVGAAGLGFETVEIYTPEAGGPGTFAPAGTMTTGRSRHTATLLGNGKVLIAGGFLAGALDSAELYDPIAGVSTMIGPMLGPRESATATLLANGKVLIAGGYDFAGIAQNSACLYDSNVFVLIGVMTDSRVGHTATLMPDGKVLLAGGRNAAGAVLASAEVFNPSDNSFLPVGSMITPRAAHAGTLLPGGGVLVAGGYDGNVYQRRAELFDPATSTFIETGILQNGRSGAQAVVLGQGTVMVAGGGDAVGNVRPVEFYYPADPPYMTEGFESNVPLLMSRSQHSATRLPNGLVLIAGGFDAAGNAIPTAELCNPMASICYMVPGLMNTPRAKHTATLLANGKVLIAGGWVSGTTQTAAAELYDPQAGTFMPTGSMSGPRYYQTATLLPNGQVLILGGTSAHLGDLYDPTTGVFTQTAGSDQLNLGLFNSATLLRDGRVLVTTNDQPLFELYDYTTQSFTLGTTLAVRTGAEGQTQTLLADGRVLIAGGFSAGTAAVIYNPMTGTRVAATMNNGRCGATATLLANGKVLFTGGSLGPGGTTPITSVELFDPATGTFSLVSGASVARTLHAGTLLGNGKVLLTGGANGAATLSTTELYRPR